MAELSDGQKLIQEFEDAGYSDEYIAGIKNQRSKAALDGGYSQREIDTFWGDGPSGEVNAKMAENNLKSEGWKLEDMPTAKGAWEVLGASFGMSVTSLNTFRRRPTMQLPDPASMSWGESIASAVGSLGDVPAMIPGAVGTMLATKNPMAVGAGTMAFTESLRQGSLYSYRKYGKWTIDALYMGPISAPKEVAKQTIMGAAAGKAGQLGYDAAIKVASPKVAALAANVAGTITGTGVGAALNGQVPTVKDFTVAAVLMALMPGSHYGLSAQVAKTVGARARTVLTDAGEKLSTNVQEIWAKTSVPPVEQVRIAVGDKIARQSMLGPDADGVVVAEPWEGHRKPEPEPYKNPKAEEEVEIIGGMKEKPAEDGLIDQLVPADKAKPSPDTGIMPVKSIKPDQLEVIASIDDPVNPDQVKALEAASRKYKNDDGSVDLEAVLIDHVEGKAAAELYRANGRDYGALNPRTQRFLEAIGSQLDEDGYVPPPRKPQEGDGAGKPPPPPSGGAGLPAKDKPPGKGEKVGGTIFGTRPKEEAFARDMEFVAEDINANIAKQTQGTDFADYYRQFKAAWREFAPIAAVDKMLGLGKKYGDLGIEAIARLQKSADDRFDFRVKKGGGGYRIVNDEKGRPQYEADYKVPTFHSIIKGAKKLTHGVDGWNAYMMALDAIDRARLGLKTTTTMEQASEAIQAIPAKDRKAYEQLSKDYQAMMEDSLYGVHQHGGISKAGIVEFRKRHPNYFPQQVFIPKTEGMLKRNVGKLFRKAKGHKMVLKDPKLSTLEMLRKRERFNSANLVRSKAVAELQKHFESSSRALVKVAVKPVEPTILDANGMVITAAEEAQFFKFNEAEIIHYADGFKTTYAVPEFPGRAEFMKALLSENVFDRDIAVAGISVFSQTARLLITSMPAYIWRMVVRDSYQHAVATKYGGVVGMNLIRGAYDMIDTVSHGKFTGGKNLMRGKAKADEALLNGAWVGGLQHQDMNQLLSSYHELENTGFIGSMINGSKHPIEFLHKATRMMDATVRVGGTYTGARGKLGALGAADTARLVGGDFAERSNSAAMNIVASVTPFWTGFQRAGIDSVSRSVQQDPMGMGIRGVMNITIPTIALTALASLLEDEFDIPEVDRMSNIDRRTLDNFMFIPWVWNGELYRFPIPLPYGVGSLFASPVHRMNDYMKDDPRAFKDWRYNVAMSFIAGALPGVDNPLASALLEGASGYDFSFGKPIVPQRFEHVSGYNAYHPYTSEIAKSVSRWVGEPGLDLVDLTPIMIEKQIQNFTGTAGKELMRIYDLTFKDNVAVADWANTPFLGSFFARHPGLNSRPIMDFYDEMEKFRNAKGDIAIAETRMDYEEMLRASQDEDAIVKLDEAADALRTIRAMTYSIMDAKSSTYKDAAGKQMSDSDIANDKRQQIDNLATIMIGISKGQLQMLDAIRKGRAKK